MEKTKKEELIEKYIDYLIDLPEEEITTDLDATRRDFKAGFNLAEELFKAKWINVEEVTPPFNEPVLIKYIKGKQGEVITQGYYRDEAERMGTHPNSKLNTEFWRNNGYGLTWFDYSGRQIQNLVAKGSKNKVVAWMNLPK